MKIVVDKIEAHPPHAFSPQELRAFLRLLPGELLRDVAIVRLSSAIEYSAAIHIAAFSRLERRLVIVSRRVSRDDAMLAVLRCLIESNVQRLAAYGCGPGSLPMPSIHTMAKELFASIAHRMPDAPRWSRLQLKYLPGPKREIA